MGAKVNQFDGIERLTEDQERKIWAEWIEPIVKKYYEGAIEYKFFEEPESITQGDFKRFWKYNLASFIYKIKPPDVLNTMTDEEWYIGVCDNPLEPRVRK
jgi:hypothetical protein